MKEQEFDDKLSEAEEEIAHLKQGFSCAEELEGKENALRNLWNGYVNCFWAVQCTDEGACSDEEFEDYFMECYEDSARYALFYNHFN